MQGLHRRSIGISVTKMRPDRTFVDEFNTPGKVGPGSLHFVYSQVSRTVRNFETSLSTLLVRPSLVT